MERETPDTRQALEALLEATNLVFDALLEPYASLASEAPTATLGRPLPVKEYVRPGAVHAIAERVVEGGRPGWALHQVEERERQLGELVRDYRAGRYRSMESAAWIAKVQAFRDTVLSDIRTALQAPRGWDRIDLGANPASRNNHGFGKAMLTPKDVAPQLGLDERTVRRRIQEGALGPWAKQGGRWTIPTDAFLRHWADQLLDDDVPRPDGEDRTDDELNERLVHLRLGRNGKA